MRKKRVFCILPGLVMAIGLMLGMSLTAYADTAPDATWSENQSITESSNLGAVTVTADITVTIPEGVTLNVSRGIDATDHALTVDGMGTLIVNGAIGSDGVSPDPGKAVKGSDGGNGFVGNLIVKGTAVEVRGGNGGNGSSGKKAGDGGNGGHGIVGEVTLDSGSLVMSGADGGKGGEGGTSYYEISYPGENGKAVEGTVSVAEGFSLEESDDNTAWTTVFGDTTQKRYARIEETTILKYPLWVGGVQVTSENADDVLKDTPNEGKASFDPQTSTLTLNGATICGETTFAMYNRWNRSANIYARGIDLKIILEGTNVIDSGETPADYAIYSNLNEETEITGEGALTVKGERAAVCMDDADCTISGVKITAASEEGSTIVALKKLWIKSGQITASAGSEDNDALHASEEVIISDGNVTATGTDDGIYAGDSVTIEGGTLHAAGTKAGIFSYGDVTVTGGTVTAEGTAKDTAKGISADNELTISGGIVTATGTDSGIYAEDGNVTIKAGTVTATGTDGGIYAEDGNVIIEAGTVTATGTDGGICADGGNVTIESGRVDASASGREAAGIYAYSYLTIKDGRVNASSAGRDAIGICAYKGVTIEGGSTQAFATGRKTVGIYTHKNITIKDGTVTASGKGKGSYSGIEAEKEVMISGGTVTASSDNIGIISDDSRDITITGGRVDANGGDNGICSDNGKVTITGGNVTSFGGDGCGVCSAEITIGEKVAKVTSAGTERAFAGYDKDYIGNIVKNSVTGIGWTNVKGTGNGENIGISTKGRKLIYKRVQFPVDPFEQEVKYAKAQKVKLASVKARKGRKAVVRWKKNPAADGYQIYYKAKGVKAKKINIKNAKTLKKTVKKLKAGKKYTFKVRTFTKVKNPAKAGTTIKVYGKWSKTRKVRVRK